MSGRLAIVGLGPGAPGLLAPDAAEALAAASDLVGYETYMARVPPRPGQRRHASDNREELDRAHLALGLAAAGREVAVVSSRDAGVFAMAAAVFEAIDGGEPAWRALDVEVIPGISAMLAAAARAGAPLGHDFCCLSLSDNLKPWEVVLHRLEAAAGAGFVLALYNPVSRARPWQLAQAFERLGAILPAAAPVVFATAVSRPDERIEIVPLQRAAATAADMRTVILVGSAQTRTIARGDGGLWVYTPRRFAEVPA
jgi:precorrin-3B C17-methyltransferase